MNKRNRRGGYNPPTTKREAYIHPHYGLIEVGDEIVVRTGSRNYKVTVLSSTSTQIKVHVVFHSKLEEDQTYSKTTGKRIRCSEWDKYDSIAMNYDPYRLITWEDMDKAEKATEAQQRKDTKAKRLNDFKWYHNGLTEDQLDEVISLMKTFNKEV